MADIIDPEAITFCNERVRPLAEKLRNLQAEMQDTIDVWNAGMDAIIGMSVADNIIDNRPTVTPLTAADVTALGAEVTTILARFAEVGVMDTIRKPCVRPLRTVGD